MSSTLDRTGELDTGVDITTLDAVNANGVHAMGTDDSHRQAKLGQALPVKHGGPAQAH